MKDAPIIHLLNSAYFCDIKTTKEKLLVMILKNIISALSFLFILSACSMDEDAIPSGSNSPLANQEVLVSVNLSLDGIPTKSTTTEGDDVAPSGNKESFINSAVVALVNSDGNVMMIRNIIAEGVVKDVSFLTKVASGVKAIAIVNSAKESDYLGCTTVAKLNEVVENNVNQDYLVKVGEKADIFNGYAGGSTSTTPVEGNKLTVEIPVKQLAARIDLMGIRYTKAEGSSAINSVEITDVSLVNTKKNSYIFSEAEGGYQDAFSIYGETTLTEGIWVGNDPINTEIGNSLGKGYSYTNTSESSSVKMRITYSMNGEAKEAYVIINNGQVQSGYLYRLYIGMKIMNDKVETTVTCYTKDWIKENVNIEVK